jgi:hypothetical protein
VLYRGSAFLDPTRFPKIERVVHNHHISVHQPYSIMDDILTAQFDRVEMALGTLVESIAAYNPSPQAALDLVAADDELSHGLEQRTSQRRAHHSDN